MQVRWPDRAALSQADSRGTCWAHGTLACIYCGREFKLAEIGAPRDCPVKGYRARLLARRIIHPELSMKGDSND